MYVAKFDALSKYGMLFIDTPLRKNKKFIIILDDYLGEKLVDHIDEPFESLLRKHFVMRIYILVAMVVSIEKEKPKP